MLSVSTNGVARRLAGQSFLYGMGNIGASLLGFVTIPIITRYLSLTEYGILGLMGSVGGFMGYFFHLNANVLFGNDYVQAKNDDERRLVLSTMYFFGILSSLAWSIIALAAAKALASIVFNAPDYSVYVRITIITSLLVSMNVVVISYLQMSQRVLTYSLVSFSSAAMSALLIVIALVIFHVNLEQLMWLGVPVGIGTTLWYFWIIRPELLPALSSHYTRETLRMGIPTVGHSLAHWVLTSLDLIFLQRFSTKAEVGLYTFAYKFGILMHIFAYGFAAAWGPHLTRTLAQNLDPESQTRFITRPYKMALAALSSIGLGLTLFAPETIHVLAPTMYMAALPAVPWIILGYLFLILYYGTVNVPQYMKKHKYLPLTTGGAAVCNALLNWWLIPRYGMMAAAVTTAISYAFLFATTLILSQLSMRVPIPNLRGISAIAVQVVAYVLVASFTNVQAFSVPSMIIRAAVVLLALGGVLLIMFPGSEGLQLIREAQANLTRQVRSLASPSSSKM